MSAWSNRVSFVIRHHIIRDICGIIGCSKFINYEIVIWEAPGGFPARPWSLGILQDKYAKNISCCPFVNGLTNWPIMYFAGELLQHSSYC